MRESSAARRSLSKHREFVEAARALGALDGRLIWRHLLPNVWAPIAVVATFSVARTIIAEASLSFLGLGVPAPTPSWGAMLDEGRNYITTGWWLALFPGTAILIVVLVINLIGDWLRDALDPRVGARHMSAGSRDRSGAGPHVVILGGGFGGLAAARALARAPVRITLLDRHNHHLFQPLLYQVATAGLSPAEIASPIRRILSAQRNVTVLLAEATAVDPEAKRVRLADGDLSYDQLILATGATHSYFGRDDWSVHAPGLKTLDDALEIRHRVLLAFEKAEREENAERRRQWLTLVVVGGGPTGVEMAGALAEIARHTLPGDFRHIDPTSARVVLVEAGPRVLATYPSDLSESARRQLEALGVHVWTGAAVTAVDAEGVQMGADRLAARTVVWAAGVEASPLARSLNVQLDRAGRVRVEPDLERPGTARHLRDRRSRGDRV